MLGLGPVSAVSAPDTLGVQRPSGCAKRDLRSGLRNRKRGRLAQAPGRQTDRYAGEETGEEDGLQDRAGTPPGPALALPPRLSQVEAPAPSRPPPPNS